MGRERIRTQRANSKGNSAFSDPAGRRLCGIVFPRHAAEFCAELSGYPTKMMHSFPTASAYGDASASSCASDDGNLFSELHCINYQRPLNRNGDPSHTAATRLSDTSALAEIQDSCARSPDRPTSHGVCHCARSRFRLRLRGNGCFCRNRATPWRASCGRVYAAFRRTAPQNLRICPQLPWLQLRDRICRRERCRSPERETATGNPREPGLMSVN